MLCHALPCSCLPPSAIFTPPAHPLNPPSCRSDAAHSTVIRSELVACWSKANIPGRSPLERDRMLHVVVVGGGPTGVEFAGELAGRRLRVVGCTLLAPGRTACAPRPPACADTATSRLLRVSCSPTGADFINRDLRKIDPARAHEMAVRPPAASPPLLQPLCRSLTHGAPC